jgi:formylglycine-generating enzyme required for sulfatase activity
MVEIPGGTFLMGSTDFYPEERPVREVTVEAFWMDESPVTNAQFRCFIEDTGYVTCAERAVTSAQYPNADPALLVPGSAVFHKPRTPVDLRDLRNWWTYVPGASWCHPEGPGSDLEGRETHPVVHVAYEDAASYARWAGKELASEAEWEFAARGGLSGATYAWGDEFAPGGRRMANTWEGSFPWNRRNTACQRTSPVGSFPPNGYGLYDMIGNVWEWTAEPWYVRPPGPPATSCCSGPDPSPTPVVTGVGTMMVVKGGSYLCAPNYCRRYRPAARQGEAIDTSTSHIGFRCVERAVSRGRRGADADTGQSGNASLSFSTGHIDGVEVDPDTGTIDRSRADLHQRTGSTVPRWSS